MVFAQETDIQETDKTEAKELEADSKAAIGAGIEWNMNSRKNFAMGAVLGFDVNIGESFALGFNSTFSSNFFDFYVIEPAAMFRWYFLSREHLGLFAQAEAGVFLIFENEGFSLMPLGGLRAGFRFPLGQNFYVEPFGRLGYPFAFGVGAAAGIRLPNKAAVLKEKKPADKSASLASEIEAILEEKKVADVSVVVTEQGVMITLSDINFPADSAVLPDSEKIRLQEVAFILRSLKDVKLLIVGHTALAGSASGRVTLSRQRAKSVADYLVMLVAVKAADIIVEGYGADRPVADNATPEGRAANRRVEIIILRE